MAIVPVPERGQPLDVAYVAQLANAINNLSSQVSPATYKYVSVDTPQGRQNVKASEAKIIGGYLEVVKNSTVTAGNEKDFSYDYDDFKYRPVVTVTPQNIGTTGDAGKDVTVVLKEVTTSKVTGVVKFNTSGDVSVAVNLLIVGIPN